MPSSRRTVGASPTETHVVPYQLRSLSRNTGAVNGDNDSDDDSFRGQDSARDGDQHVEPLPKPAVRGYEASFLIEMIEEEGLDLSPAYHRGDVWTDEAKSSFISSLLMNVHPPMIYLNKVALGTLTGPADGVYACVDGKQRLTSLQQFLNGKIPCKYQGRQLWYSDDSATPNKGALSKQKVIMPEEMKKQLKDTRFPCAVYRALTRAQEIELFKCLQFSKPLTVAEKAEAQRGPWETLAKRFEIDYRLVVGLVRNKRATGFRAILQSFIQIIECLAFSIDREAPDAKFSMKAIESFCADKDSFTNQNKRHLEEVFGLFSRLASEEDSPFTAVDLEEGTKSFAPVELIAIACLISQKKDQLSLTRMKKRVKRLRIFLRLKHKHLRISAAVWKTAWEFIAKQ